MRPIYNTSLFLAQVLNPLRGKQMQIKISLLSQTECGLGLRSKMPRQHSLQV